jgi:hypothetical protein
VPYKVSYEDRGNYLFVHMEGPESYEEAMLFWKNLRIKAETEHLTNFLIVDEVTGVLNSVEVLSLSLNLGKMFIGATIAYVDPKKESFNANNYGGSIVRKCGVNAQVFVCESEAVTWLATQKEK